MLKKACSVILAVLFLLTLTSSVSAQVVMNEFLPAPSSGGSEWVEIYNTASASADLSDYYFDDDDSFGSDSGNSAIIAISGILPGLSTCYWNLTSYLNNNGDKPTLFNTSGTTIDSYTYTVTQTDKSYSRVPDGGNWQLHVTPTKSSVSCIDLAPSPTPTPTPTASPTPAPTATSTPTPTKTPTATPTKTSSPTPTKNPTPTPEESEDEEPPGSNETSEPTPTVSPVVLGESTGKKPSILPYLLIGLGVLCLGASGYFLYNGRRAQT